MEWTNGSFYELIICLLIFFEWGNGKKWNWNGKEREWNESKIEFFFLKKIFNIFRRAGNGIWTKSSVISWIL